jgi:hypothetical protein
MRFPRGGPLVALVVLAVTGCRSHHPAAELQVSDVSTYWIVDNPRQGQNYIAPAVRFRLKNVSSRVIDSVQARARFPVPEQEEAWGSIQEQVSTWKQPIEPGRDVLVTVRSVGRYHADADPEDLLRSPAFKDPRVEVFVRIGASEAKVERHIGAPGVLPLPSP